MSTDKCSYLRINGVSLYYEVHGQGYPVVFIHGYGGSLESWRYQVADFSRKHLFIALDLPGHGKSDSPPSMSDYSADAVVEDIARLLDELGVQKAIVCGHSLGGYIALRFQLKHPERVTALILVGTGPGFRDPARRKSWNLGCQEYAQVLENHGITAFAARFPGILDKSDQDALGLAKVARKMMTQLDSDVIENLSRIRVPTLILVGEKDKRNFRSALYMVKAIPRARYRVIPKSGHTISLHNPEGFNRAVMNFLEANETALTGNRAP